MNITNTRKALNLIISTLDTTKATLSPIEFTERKPHFQPMEAGYFEGVTPESCGIESGYIEEFIKALANTKEVGLQSIMLMRGDKVFFEADIGRQDSRLPKATFSESKSIIALAIGKLITQGKLKLSERITDIFADRILPVAKIRLKGLTVKHLLNMTAGVTFNELEAMVTDDWVKEYLNSDIEGEMGKTFRYNSMNSYMLAAIITERTGMSVSEYLGETIFKALEIKDFYWEKCPKGIEKGGWGLYIRREDLAKLGLLVMQKGYWKGKKIIASKYITDATKPRAEVPEEYGGYNYGFHIWAGRDMDSFLFNGMLGQNLIGYRENGIMVIANCSNCDMFQQNAFFDICDEYLAAEFRESIPENEEEYRRLNLYKESLKTKSEIKSFLPGNKYSRILENDLNAIDGKCFRVNCLNSVSTGFAPLTMQLIQGNYTYGLEEIRFSRSEKGLTAEFVEGDEIHTAEMGFGEAIRGEVSFRGEVFAIACQGFFSENEDGVPMLKLECDFIETPYTKTYKFFFEDGNHWAEFCEYPAYGLTENMSELIGLFGGNGQKIESAFSKIDGDYFAIKLEKAFAPRLSLEIAE